MSKINWLQVFYARNRLEPQIKLIQEKVTISIFNAVSKTNFTQHGDRELEEIWSELQLRIPLFFGPETQKIRPALLHGDLWSGNAAQTALEPGDNSHKANKYFCRLLFFISGVWSRYILRTPRVRISYCGHVWGLQKGLLQCLPQSSTKTKWLRATPFTLHPFSPAKPLVKAHSLTLILNKTNRISIRNHFGIGYRDSTLDVARKLLKN